MGFLKRTILFVITNLAVVLLLNIVVMIVSQVFGIDVGRYGGHMGLFIFALIFGFGGAFISLLTSKMAAKFMMKVNVIKEGEAFDAKEILVFQTVKNIAMANGIRIPEVGIYESQEPNAFATGPSKNNSLVAVSSGLLETMTEEEIEGVVAHEMAHILNGDMVTMTLLQGVLNTFVIFFARAIAMAVEKFYSDENGRGNAFIYYGVSFVLELIFGILATMIIMAFSRHREYRADEGSAKFVGKDKMVAALRALQELTARMTSDDTAKLATLKISTKKKRGIVSLFSSHPDLSDRIKNLQKI